MSSAEFAQWIAFASREPIGDRRMDFRFALLAVKLGAAFGGEIKLNDVMPDFWGQNVDELKEQSPDELISNVRAAFGMKGNKER